MDTGSPFELGASIGPGAESIVNHLLTNRPHPEMGCRARLGLLGLARKYGKERLEVACQRALVIGSPTRRSVLSILKKRRDKAAAIHFFSACCVRLRCHARSSPISCAANRSNGRDTGVAERKHVFVKVVARLNNPPENSHHRRANARGVCAAFVTLKRTRAFLSSFGLIRQHFALKRHPLRVSLYRRQLAAQFVTWRNFSEVTRNPSTDF